MKILQIILVLLLLVPGSSSDVLYAAESAATQPPTSFKKQLRKMPRESLFDITFGSPPPLATERGILIIEAYNDLNANQKRDPDEPELTDQVSCRVGDQDYQVPAFIPGLDYNQTYTVACTGKTYHPVNTSPDIFIEKRGQIIRLNLPCSTVTASASPAPPAPPAKP